MAQKLSDRWFTQGQVLVGPEKDIVARAYISAFLTLGDEVVKKFEEGDPVAREQVGMRQAGVGERDIPGFWRAMARTFPFYYRKEEVDYLVLKGKDFAVFHLVNQFRQNGAPSALFSRLEANAHVYR